MGSVGLASVSLLLVLPAPSYDPWAWLLWGRELAGGELNTLEGPAFKPLPVALCTVLTPFGSAAPWLWVLLARSAAVLAIWLAFRLGRRLGGESLLPGLLAAVGVAACGQYLTYASSGVAEGMLLASALAAVEFWRAGRPRWSLACAVGCALLRVETWPFLLAAATIAWRRRPQDRALLLCAALLVPAAWFVPEIIGSGDPLRSAARARIPNPGNPALAAVPALASLKEAVALLLWPLWAGVALLAWRAGGKGDHAARAALTPAAVGLAWMALVATMAQVGFSGEARYAMPGAVLVAISGAIGLGTATPDQMGRRGALAVTAALVALAAVPRAGDLVSLRRAQAYQWALQADLSGLVTAVGGGESVLACGRPFVGPVRAPLAAWHLGVAKPVVEADLPPQPPGVVFRSSLTAGDPAMPAVPATFEQVAHKGVWVVFASCRTDASLIVASGSTPDPPPRAGAAKVGPRLGDVVVDGPNTPTRPTSTGQCFSPGNTSTSDTCHTGWSPEVSTLNP